MARPTMTITSQAVPRRSTSNQLVAGLSVPEGPRFNPGLVAEMTAQGLSEEDAVAALESCNGDGEQVSRLPCTLFCMSGRYQGPCTVWRYCKSKYVRVG